MDRDFIARFRALINQVNKTSSELRQAADRTRIVIDESRQLLRSQKPQDGVSVSAPSSRRPPGAST